MSSWSEHVDVAVVVQALQGVQGARLCPQFAVAREAQLFRHGVGGKKTDAVDVHGQAVGVLAHHRKRLLPVVTVDAHGVGGADPVRLQEHDQVADALVVGPARLDALQGLAAHAADPQQPFRLFVQHAEGVLAEGVHDARGHGFAHALDQAGPEIVADALHGCGQQVLVAFHGELPPEARVVHPAAHQLQRGSRLRRNHVPHHAEHVALDAVEHAGKLHRGVLRLLQGGQHGRCLAGGRDAGYSAGRRAGRLAGRWGGAGNSGGARIARVVLHGVSGWGRWGRAGVRGACPMRGRCAADAWPMRPGRYGPAKAADTGGWRRMPEVLQLPLAARAAPVKDGAAVGTLARHWPDRGRTGHAAPPGCRFPCHRSRPAPSCSEI